MSYSNIMVPILFWNLFFSNFFNFHNFSINLLSCEQSILCALQMRTDAALWKLDYCLPSKTANTTSFNHSAAMEDFVALD